MTDHVFKPRQQVSINGRLRRALAAQVTFSADSRIAQGQIALVKAEGTPLPDDIVTFGVAANGAPGILFRGLVASVPYTYFPNGIAITVQGFLSRAARKLGLSRGPDDPLVDEDGLPIPVASFGAAAEGGSPITDGPLVQALLTLAGVSYDAGAIADAAWPMGQFLPVVLARGEDPLSLIQRIDLDTHMVTMDGPGGLVVRVPWFGLPNGSPTLLLQQGAFPVIDLGRQTSYGQMVNRVNVTGAALDAFTVSDTVEADSLVNPHTGTAYIPTPPGHWSYDHQSALIQDADLATAFGEAYLAEHNRLQDDLTAKLSPGNPTIFPGTSALIVAAAIDYGVGQVARVASVVHRTTVNSYKVDLTLIGAYAAEGVSTNLAPLPSFTITVIWEHWANGAGVWIVICDASASLDPDGAYDPIITDEHGVAGTADGFNGIAAYVWSSTLGVTPKLGLNGARATYIVTSDPQGESITLTVYDLHGKHAALTQTIDYADTTPLLVRDLWGAIKTDLIFTNDAELTWQRVGIAAVGCVRRAARTYTLAWTAGGALYRVTAATPPVATLISSPANATAANIRWSFPDTSILGTRAWVGCADGKVYRSITSGVIFTLVSTVPNGQAVTFIEESPYAENEVWVTAGNTLYVTFDGVNWATVYAHPHAALTAVGYASGFNSGFVVFAGTPASPDATLEASRIQERHGLVAGDWTKLDSATILAAGTYTFAYAFEGAGGVTALSPTATLAISGSHIASLAPVWPLPAGARAVRWYASIAPGSSTLREFARTTGYDPVLLSVVPLSTDTSPPTSNTTLTPVANPVAAPVPTQVAPADAVTHDFPAQPTAIALGVYQPFGYVSGTSQDGSGQVWRARIDRAFTLARGFYDSDQFGIPHDLAADGALEGIVYGAADHALVKSLDGFAETCASIYNCVGSEQGLRIGFGDLHPIAQLPGTLIVSAYQYNDFSIHQIVKFASGVWTVLNDHPFNESSKSLLGDGQAFDSSNSATVNGSGQLGTFATTRPLLKAPNGYLYTYAYLNRGDEIDSVTPTYPNVWKSVDGGTTWTNLTVQGVRGMDIGVDGTLWAVAGDGARVEKSTNAGSSWSTAITNPDIPDGFWAPYAKWNTVACDPIAANTVIIFWRGGTKLTTDGFTTPPFQVSDTEGGGVSGARGIVRTSAGNASVYGKWNGSTILTHRLVDAGTHTTVLGSPFGNYNGDQGPEYRRLAGGRIVMVGNSYGDGSAKSDDGGVTWAALFVKADLPVSSATAIHAIDVARDAASDSLFMAVNGQPGTPYTQSFVAQYAGAAWVDISTNHVAELGGRFYSHRLGMVVLAGAATGTGGTAFGGG